MSNENRTYDREERLIDFAVRIIRTAESLPKTRVGGHIAGQLICCGTSPAPNYGEAQSAESRPDVRRNQPDWSCIREIFKEQLRLTSEYVFCKVAWQPWDPASGHRRRSVCGQTRL